MTPLSPSLCLVSWGTKDLQFVDTSRDIESGNLVTHNGITAQWLSPNGSGYVAPLDRLPQDQPPRYSGFEDWWARVIFVDKMARKLLEVAWC